MISAAQLAQRRTQATRLIETAFPTTITIAGGSPIAAARWSAGSGGDSELAGILPTADVAFRVRRELLTSTPIIPERTTLVETNGGTYRVERVRDALGDPAIVLECKAV